MHYTLSTYRTIFQAVLCAYRSHYCPKIVRTVWCKPRSRHWWRAVQSGIVGNEWWKENLHMSRDTFTFICSKLHPFIEKQVSIKALFIVIIISYYTCTYTGYQFLISCFCGRESHRNGVEISYPCWIPNAVFSVWPWALNCWQNVIEMCHAITIHLLPHYVQIPCGQKLREIVDGFETF